MRILIITAPISSNLYATIKFAKFLQKENKVFYATGAPAYQLAIQQNLEVMELKTSPFGYNQEKFNFFFQAITIRQHYKKRKQEFEFICKKIDPEIVYIDSFASTDILFLKEALKHVKIVYIHPMLSLSTIKQFPDYNKSFNDIYSWNTNSILNNLLQVLKIIVKLAFIKTKKILHFLLHFGSNSSTFAKTKFDLFKLELDTEFLLNFKVKGISELILAPEELEYEVLLRDKNQYYLGLCVPEDRVDSIESEFCLEEIINLKRNYHSTIYISFGTFSKSKKHNERVKKFLLLIFKIAKTMPNMFFIISSTIDFNRIEIQDQTIPNNIGIYKFLPQIQILKIVNAFISHGGLGSIKEAIFTKTPLIICPLDYQWDQKGNASKVEYYNLGIDLGEIDKISYSSLLQALNQITKCKIYQESMNKFLEKINLKYTNEYWSKSLSDCFINTKFS